MIRKLWLSLRRRVRAIRALKAARRHAHLHLQRTSVRRILVVCYGNIYRSPFVGEYLRQLLGSAYEIRTAGFHKVTERPSPARHVEMCNRVGVDLSRHRSAKVTSGDLDWADTVILMDRHNWNALDDMGVAREKLVWLGALNDGDLEIKDPYQLDDADAAIVINAMQVSCRTLADRLCSRSDGDEPAHEDSRYTP